MNAPAFKEWQVITEALGAGEQIIILRKGGISENRGNFQVEARRFWLFPTQFHAQRDKTKPAAAKWFAPVGDPATVTLRYFADVVGTVFLADWEKVARLDPFHCWTEAAVREKFDWSKPPGLHVLVVRVHRLCEPLTLPVTPGMAGCKSWIELPPAFDAQPSDPVITDAVFAARLEEMTAHVPVPALIRPT